MTIKNKLLIFNFIIIILLMTNIAVSFFNIYTYSLFLCICFISLRLLIGWEKDNSRYKKDSIMIIAIYGIFYNIFVYLIGLFLGFLKSPYSTKLIGIIKNIIPVILIILFSELIRYLLVKKGRTNKFILFLTVFVMTLIDIELIIKVFNFNIGTDIVKFTLVYLCTSLSKNVFLTYLTYHVGYKPSLIYRLIFEIPIYLLPISPDLGIYVDTIFKIILPLILTYILYKLFIINKHENIIETSRKKLFARINLAAFTGLMLIVVGLTCGWFKYYTLVVGSGSMTPNINTGDIVITEKLNEKQISNLKIGDILVYKHEDKVIIHRIIDIDKRNNKLIFYTKGDNNKNNDEYPIDISSIIGTVKFKIRYLGGPTIWLNEMVEKMS